MFLYFQCVEEQLDDCNQHLRQQEERVTQSNASNRLRESHLVYFLGFIITTCQQ